MTTPPTSQSDFLESKLDSKLDKSTTFQPSSLGIERAYKSQQSNSIALPADRVLDKMNAESWMSSDEKANAASEDANLKTVWDDTMKDLGVTGKPHRNTAVLMISWAEKFDDLHTKAEVNELGSVFTELFHYTVRKQQLSELGDKPPSLQISKYLVEFVCDFNSDSTMLIVYYAGHGIPGKPGELHLAGNRQPDRELSIWNAAAWHDAERILKSAEADILLIFDCCYAGNLLPCDVHPHYPTRSFECIAACGRDKETARPGKKSFTAALIWSLKDLEKDRKSFTTQDLQTRIMKAPGFPEKQFVPLLQHDEPRDQRLVLAPLLTDSNTIPPKFKILTPTSNELPQNYLDLRFWFLNRPDKGEIENLASQFTKLMKEEHISASRIGWLGLKKGDWRRTVTSRNVPVELEMKGKIASPGSVLRASIPFESQTSKSLSPSPHLKSYDVSKAGQSETVSTSISRQEHETMGMADRNLTINTASSITREANFNQYDYEPNFTVDFKPTRHRTQVALLRGMQGIHIALGVAAVAVLALSIALTMHYN